MNFLEELWHLTDDIFNWKFWQVFKWVAGAIVCSVLIYLIFQVNASKEEELTKKLYAVVHHFPFHQ